MLLTLLALVIQNQAPWPKNIEPINIPKLVPEVADENLRGPVSKVRVETHEKTPDQPPEWRITKESSYNRTGHMTEERVRMIDMMRAGDKGFRTTKYSYDKLGQTEGIEYSDNGHCWRRCAYKFNSWGGLVESIMTSTGENTSWITTYSYDQDHHVIKSSEIGDHGERLRGAVWEWKRLPVGRFQQQCHYTMVTSSGHAVAFAEVIEVRVYTNSGKLVSTRLTGPEGDVGEQCTYDLVGKGYTKITNEDEKMDYKEIRSKDGRTLTTVVMKRGGKQWISEVVTFDKYGNELTRKGRTSGGDDAMTWDQVYHYTYDSHGNWTLRTGSNRTTYPDGEVSDEELAAVRRTIEYYK
jgi:hypothetical protein